MSQTDFTFTSGSGTALLAAIEAMEDALHSSHSGATEPSYKVPGLLWLDTTTATKLALKLWDGTQWQTLASFNPSNADGFAPGVLIRETVFTASDAAFALHPMTRFVRARAVGGGGAGGGATASTSGAASAGSGGNGGEELITPLLAPGAATLAVTIGAGGAGASGLSGGAGGATTVTIGGTAYSAAGGLGGAVGGQTLLLLFGQPQTQAASSVAAAETRTPPRHGAPSVYAGTTTSPTARALGGAGGDSPFGQGGLGALVQSAATTAGAAARGRGAGGGGAATTLTAAAAGGPGTAGVAILEEFA